jgi:hypothetical protein
MGHAETISRLSSLHQSLEVRDDDEYRLTRKCGERRQAGPSLCGGWADDMDRQSIMRTEGVAE